MKASWSEAAPRARTISAGESLTSTRPACISEMRSQRSPSFMKCVETKIVTPWLRERSIRSSQKPSRATGSTPEVGSSRISISGRVHDRDGQREPLADAERQRLGELVGLLAQVEALEQLVDARPDPLARQLEELRVQHQVLAHAELAVEREGLRHVADLLAHVALARFDVAAEQAGAPLGHGQEARQHLHGGRLAAAVRAEEAEDLAALDAEVHVVHGHEVAEAAGQALGLDDGLAARAPCAAARAARGARGAPPRAAAR